MSETRGQRTVERTVERIVERTVERIPPPPAPIAAWVERFGAASPEATTQPERGARALAAALDTPSGTREAAWALLAADALLTWAVEDAADAPDPAAALNEVLRVAQRPPCGFHS